MARSVADMVRDLRAARAVVVAERAAADRLAGLAVDLLRAGEQEKAKEAARFADVALRSAIAERDDPEPSWSRP